MKPQELQAGGELLVSAPNLLRSVGLLAGMGFLLRGQCGNDELGAGWVMQGWAARWQEGGADEVRQSQDVAAAPPPCHDWLPLSGGTLPGMQGHAGEAAQPLSHSQLAAGNLFDQADNWLLDGGYWLQEGRADVLESGCNLR